MLVQLAQPPRSPPTVLPNKRLSHDSCIHLEWQQVGDHIKAPLRIGTGGDDINFSLEILQNFHHVGYSNYEIYMIKAPIKSLLEFF